MEIGSNTFNVDESGRVSLSGLGSGVDWQATVDNIVAARRIPVDRLEAKVEANKLEITALQDLRTLMGTLQDGLSRLRGAVSFDGSTSIFNAKNAFASVSRTDGATPSGASNLVGVTVGNAAQAESHEIEVLQTARAHKIASDSVSSTGTALGFADGSTFTVEDVEITVSAQDTLATLRDRINAANTGSNATGVSASIVTVSSSQYYLVLNKATAGADIDIAETGGTPLQTVGLLTSGGAPKNVLQSARMAQMHVDGLLDQTDTTYETARQSSATANVGSSGTIRFDDGGTTLDLAYASTDSITDIAADINGDGTLQGMGISASVVQEGAQYRLKIVTGGDAFTMTETGAGSVLDDLGMENSRLLVERASNTVNDLLPGVTLSLFQAEVGTTIAIDVEQNLSAVKQEISAFVEAYNSVKQFINAQTQRDPTTGELPEEAVLAGNPALTEIETRLNQIVSQGTAGVDGDFSVLAQIGIDFVDNGALTDRTLADTLTIDESTLDEALLNNPDDVRRLFAFDFSPSDPRVTMLSFSGKTTYDAAGYTLNVAFAEQYDTATRTEAGAVTLTQGDTGGPAEDGIGAITLSDALQTDQALRYSYDSATETLTLTNLTTGTSEQVDITAQLDAVAGTGLDLGAGETLDVSFATLGTITLSGDDGFLRGTDIGDGTLDTAALDANTAMTNGAVTTPASGLDKATVDALIAAGAYDQATGLLTLGVTSSGSGEAHFDTAAGISFRVDGGAVLSDISGVDLDDGAAHTIDIYVNDGASDVQVGSLGFDTLASTAAGTGSLTVDLGTGLFASENTAESATAPIENYLSVTDGSFEIRDEDNTLLTTVNYTTDQSLTDIAATIDGVAGLSATVESADGAFYLRVTSDSSAPLTFTGDSGGLLDEIDITNTGTVVTSANINGSADGADDGSVTVSGSTLTMTSATGAEGLKVLYTGNTDASGIQLDFTTGVTSQLYFSVANMLDDQTGVVENAIETLDDQNTFTDERIATLLERLERQRQSLLDRFIRMETALTSMNSMLDQIKQSFEALSNSQSQ